MPAKRSIAGLKAVQAALRDALEQAAACGDPAIWNQVARALGSVRSEIERLDPDSGPAEGDAPGVAGRAAKIPSPADLAELILAALVSAEALGRNHTALILNDALISTTGKGISPEGWPTED